MVNVIQGGMDAFGAITFGVNTVNAQDYIADGLRNFSQNLTGAGQEFYSRAVDTFNKVVDSDAIRTAKALRRRIRYGGADDSIRPLQDIGALQQAPVNMQRWLMAEPTVRKLYHENRCDGYSETYDDVEPGKTGADHYHYRRVVHGMSIEDPETGELVCTNYHEEVEERDQLDECDRANILVSWSSMVERIHEAKDDPTSLFNSSL